MIKFVVIFKTIISRIVRWVNINQLNFSSKAFFQTMQNDKIIPFNDKIISIFYLFHVMLASFVIAFKVSQDLIIQ